MFTKKRVIIGMVFILLVGGLFYYFGRDTGEVVETETVKRSIVSETISLSGELVPTEYADLAFQGAGIVERIFVDKGTVVKKGDMIIAVDRSVLRSQLNEAYLALSVAEENEKLARRGWDDLKPEERAAEKLATEQARADIRTIQAQMRDSVLRAPIDGYVSQLDIRTGETVALGKIVARVAKSGDFVVEARVPESDIAKVSVGMKVRLTFDAFTNDEVFDAAVTEIDPASTVVLDVVSYVVRMRIDSIDVRLKEGMTANIDIETARKDDILTVPFRSLLNESGKTYAEVRRGETFEKVEVTTGLEGDEGTVEITSGLKEGDEIMTLTTKQP
ncbi:MAG TPA: efflux RND transporter periplasmic adaptor subunit [Patescibacteria group bacterium]|uniref:CusB-like beta-barrel domain-containing protein n=1 Tax=Candidatus Kaiserbacteria bacterium RIFCSPHIGHO2_01_FULL_54_36b TaxID=1798483 RepID=A0A1F6CN83_9BACT|nr:MAG: hypothetical protein A2704_06925 [Candidatus Kaiserbacteria bacterium RIFCSPHIGHO2_01_FULL_54_36b]HLB50902.1 efflux RND transporter periplasmic adaptor subunit [Patescibacteria group bacterium]